MWSIDANERVRERISACSVNKTFYLLYLYYT